MPVIRIDDRELQPGPFFRKAREAYWEFAHSRGSTSYRRNQPLSVRRRPAPSRESSPRSLRA
jgi:hypothetical protein